MLDTVYLINESTEPTADAKFCAGLVDALGEQSFDLGATWLPESPALQRTAMLAEVPKRAGIGLIVLVDFMTDASALAFHEELPDGTPISYVGVKTILGAGGTLKDGAFSVSQAASHEFVEMCCNPATNRTADRGDGVEQFVEVADPVEGGFYNAENGFALSDFVLEDYFDPLATKGPFNRLETLSKPFQVDHEGYAMLRDANGKVREVFGEKYDRRRLTCKAHPHSRKWRIVALAAKAHRERHVPEDPPTTPDLAKLAREPDPFPARTPADAPTLLARARAMLADGGRAARMRGADEVRRLAAAALPGLPGQPAPASPAPAPAPPKASPATSSPSSPVSASSTPCRVCKAPMGPFMQRCTKCGSTRNAKSIALV